MPARDDPLMMAELDPGVIRENIEAKSKAKVKPPSELDMKKEERLSKKEERLNTGKGAAGPSNAPLPPPLMEEMVDPSVLLDKIHAYRERFPHLRSRNKIGAKSTVSELDDEIHYFEQQLGASKEGGSIGAKVFVATMHGLEHSTHYWNPLGLELSGLGAISQQNVGDFKDVIDELMIKHGANFYMSPEARLILSVGALVATVHMANRGDGRLGDTLKKMGKSVTVPPNADGM